ncbi:PAS domain S-box-containing protein [Desulfacinum infernum DSM 9756]|uniref:histidine kinase n=1 Tax=Desulfacinum infernum DSM 9756 TaxID=1121391 RepID=A0A1M4VGB6_9BACT|nr:PAS domain S-box protein [Desulfacinum infernum]SHE68011.1 PAS domain S-box-containing protein [Desulfacinum infernum DSM 9756]
MRILLGLFLTFLALATHPVSLLAAQKLYKVCLYENPPLVGLDADRRASGLFVELLEAVAQAEGWQLQYREASWAQCLEELRSGAADILPVIAYSEERSRAFLFSSETVLTNWGVVYSRKGEKVSGILDLEGKIIAVKDQDIHMQALQALLSKFPIKAKFAPYETYDQVLWSVGEGKAHAGVVNRIYGQTNSHRFSVESTPIVFNPIEIRYGGHPGTSRTALETLDRYLKNWKQEENSVYHQAVTRWLHVTAPPPAWTRTVKITVGATILSLLLLGSAALFLKRQVRLRTQDLKTSHGHLEQALRQQKAFQSALLETEHRYQALFQKATDALLVINEDGRIQECNQAAQDLFRASRENLVGRRPGDLSPPRQPDGAPSDEKASVLFESALPGYPQRFEWVHQRPDGSLFDAEVQLSLIFQEGDARMLASIRDVTEKKAMEKAIEAQRKHLERVLDSTPIALFLVDVDGKVIFWNKASEELIGISKEDVIGTPPDFSNLFGGKPPVIPALLLLEMDPVEVEKRYAPRGIRRYPLHPEGIQTISRFQMPGGWRHVSVVAARLRDEQGNLLGVIQCGRDITQEVELQGQLVQAQKMEAIGRLAGGVAHDFNNVLTVILGYCDLLLLRSSLNPDEAKKVSEIKKMAQRASQLTGQLLAFSRKQVLQLRSVDLNAVLENLRKMLERLIGEDIRLQVTLAPGLWPVKADPVHLDQVIMNLAVNARDAMPEGGLLTLETANLKLEHPLRHDSVVVPPGEYVSLKVADTGHGMDPAIRDKVFEPFFTTKPAGVGTGLGLATVYGVVKQLGGFILVDSTPGRGTTFSVYLPRQVGAAEHVPADSQPETPHAVAGTERILVVEDEELVRTMAAETLETYGYRVQVAASGAEALEICSRDGSFDLLLTDVVMPGMDGPELARRMAEICPGIPVLFMSAYPDDRLARHGVLGRDVELLPKPFSPHQLARKVRELLDAKKVVRC